MESNWDESIESFDDLPLKKELLIARLKISMRDSVIIKDYRQKKKEVARLFTKLNSVK